MQCTVTFIRHGESLGNIDKDFYFYPDAAISLSKKGVSQCIHIMNNLELLVPASHDPVFLTFITSEFTRAKQTADIITAKLKLHSPIIHDRRLNEAYFCKDAMRLTETRKQIKHRVLSLINQYPFNLVLFCHGQLMDAIDPIKGHAKNCEIRHYDRDDLIKNLLLDNTFDHLPIEEKQ